MMMMICMYDSIHKLYAWQDGSSALPRVVSESSPINFPKMTKLDAQLWHIGAELEDGIVLMGEWVWRMEYGGTGQERASTRWTMTWLLTGCWYVDHVWV